MTPNTPALPSASTELAAIRDALEAGPTPGPWGVRSGKHWRHVVSDICTTGKLEHWRCLVVVDEDNDQGKQDADYMVACNPSAMTAVLAYVDALQAENQALRADARRLEFICSKSPLRFIEGNNDMWRVYQDEAPPEAFAHKWRAIVTMYYPTAREAIDAALSASGEGGQ